ncbi:hypothetical protein [Ruminiclostridium cellobioparum]|uniref:hypothetical protein n=1 Tax=Ruminiclostridium cellobioparum TaxID=29355 RepID=UPI0028B08ED6|nr:hypothetical protein [Ruminiclostridium cellobioparum]
MYKNLESRIFNPFVLGGNIQNSILIISEDIKITPKNIKLLEHTGIVLKRRSLYAENYPGMFSAIKDLVSYPNGFMRFVRCSYNENSDVMILVYKQFTGNDSAFEKLVDWLRKNDYKYTVTLDDSEVQDFESSRISFMKNITGNNTTIFPGYD